jgi:hypothetical protein
MDEWSVGVMEYWSDVFQYAITAALAWLIALSHSSA